MRLSKTMRRAATVLVLASVAACNQQKNSQEKFAGDGHSRLSTACGAEIQKYCADEPRKRRCLRQNADKLSDSCKAALGQRHQRRGRGGENDDNK